MIELLSKDVAQIVYRLPQLMNNCVTLVAPEHASKPATSTRFVIPQQQ